MPEPKVNERTKACLTTDRPRVTLVICTRNRPGDLQRAVAAIVAVDPAVEESLIIDQSDSVVAIEQPPARRFRHLSTATRGLSRARNEGLALARGEIVFFTDDDCLLQNGTVELVSAMFAAHPALGIVFGSVQAANSVNAEGFIPTYVPSRSQVLRGRLGKLRDGGIGACMAVRRDVALALGGFDERLGAGTPLASCEDGEFTYRALKGGYAVGHLPEAWVLHEGLKPWSDGPRFTYNTYRAIGAAYAIHLRQRDIVALLLLLQQIGVLLLRVPPNLVQRRPTGLTALRGLFSGIAVGLQAFAFSGPWPPASESKTW